MRFMRIPRSLLPAFVLVVGTCAALLGPPATQAQSVESVVSPDTTAGATDRPTPSTAQRQAGTPLSVTDAIRVALEESYGLQDVRLDVRNADAQIQNAWGRLYPQLDATGSYTRNIKTANPFAGSDVTGLFSGGGASEWVTFNEQARTDGNPNTTPITIDEFRERQQEGRREAGITPGSGGGNPFGVANQFTGALSLRQTLYNGQAFAAVQGAQTLKDLNQTALDRQKRVLVNEVRQAYYDALLAREQIDVAQQGLERAQETFQEVAQQVSAGTVPKSERLSAEVERANRETQLVQARSDYASALDGLKQTMGIEADAAIRLTDDLDADRRGQYVEVSVQSAVDRALEQRADLERARLNAELQEVRKETEQARYFPTVAAVADLSMSGRVPSDRTSVISDPTDPFEFDTQTRGVFADSYWNPSFSVGLELSWTLFDGFQRRSSIEQQEVAVQRAELQVSQLRQSVRIEVQRALRNLEAARQRIRSQSTNLETARTNYRFAQQRLGQGVSSPLRVREASRQLDQSRLNYLQAVRDYLSAKSAFEAAIGQPAGVPDGTTFQTVSLE
jgi:outer membrane protein TolC